MVSIFLVFVAVLSSFWGGLLLYETYLTSSVLTRGDLLVPLMFGAIAAVCFGSAAVLDGLKTSAQEMARKLDELASG